MQRVRQTRWDSWASWEFSRYLFSPWLEREWGQAAKRQRTKKKKKKKKNGEKAWPVRHGDSHRKPKSNKNQRVAHMLELEVRADRQRTRLEMLRGETPGRWVPTIWSSAGWSMNIIILG
ncbi:hypothetical protein GX51_06563 [Blastomyces parvus]|uniref:Uncharacterized protein n=1 Tax=Blastomyces parvus TaxID=2060905 RepID=A0A2B7WQQ2_9EURO|nr:hypothetical protein GX51_06563 [Blastomyces parvus]